MNYALFKAIHFHINPLIPSTKFLPIFHPPWGSKWVISVGGYVDNSLTSLGSSDPREVRLELAFYVFHFRFVPSLFCFLLTEFHDTFPTSYKTLPYYVNIVPQRG